MLLLLKSHIPGYTKKDGTYVKPHETKAKVKAGQQMALFNHKAPLPADAFANVGAPAEQPVAKQAAPATKNPDAHQAAKPQKQWPMSKLLGKQGGSKGAWWKDELSETKGSSNAITHPQPHDNGSPVKINDPHTASGEASWSDPAATAVFTPGGAVPAELNGVAVAPWAAAPTDIAGWVDVPGQKPDLDEPEMPKGVDFKGNAKEEAAGVIVEEPDGRVWVMCPTNQFGGYKATFPKGRVDPGLTRQAAAIKECYEETGLQVEITGYHGDIERSTTVARYYTARRVGGSPAAMGWEAQAVQLAPKMDLFKVLNTPVDHKILLMGEKE